MSDIPQIVQDAVKEYGMNCVGFVTDNAGNAHEALSALYKALRNWKQDIEAPLLSIARSANNLRYECYRAAHNAGWWRVPVANLLNPDSKVDIRSYPQHMLQWWIGTKLALIHSEVSEALEGLRKDKQDEHLPHLKSLDVELADAVIRIMDLAGGLNIDIGRAIAEKLAYNAQRADHKPENRDKAGGKAF